MQKQQFSPYLVVNGATKWKPKPSAVITRREVTSLAIFLSLLGWCHKSPEFIKRMPGHHNGNQTSNKVNFVSCNEPHNDANSRSGHSKNCCNSQSKYTSSTARHIWGHLLKMHLCELDEMASEFSGTTITHWTPFKPSSSFKLLL